MINKYKLYDILYGHIPNDFESRLKLLFQGRNPDALEKLVEKNIRCIKRIKNKKIIFTWYVEIQPAKRPRVTTAGAFPRFYVPGASQIKAEFLKFFNNEFPDFKIISTPISIKWMTYIHTPASFSKVEKILAEKGYLKPWIQSAGDLDNIAKSLYDSITDSLISNDALIIHSEEDLLYSIKPRVEVEITYMEKFPEVTKK